MLIGVCFIFYPPLPQTSTNVPWELTHVPSMPTAPTPLAPIIVIAPRDTQGMGLFAQIVLEGMIVLPLPRAIVSQGRTIAPAILGTLEMGLFVRVSCPFSYHSFRN